jgi:hypothetical protein
MILPLKMRDGPFPVGNFLPVWQSRPDEMLQRLGFHSSVCNILPLCNLYFESVFGTAVGEGLKEVSYGIDCR